MKLVHAAAGVADLGFAVMFLTSPGTLAEGAEEFVHARWLGVCLFASAAMLFFIASDPERYLPVLYVNVGARIVVALVGLLYLFSRQFPLVIMAGAIQGILAAVLVAALVYAARQERAAAASSGAEAKLKPKPKGKPAGGKKGKRKKG